MKAKLIPVLVAVVVAGMVLAFARPMYRQGERSIAGKPAPDFALELDGKPARLSSLKGKVVVLNFWATWCPPCVEEMPSLERMHRQVAASGATVVGVSVDDNAEAYARFLLQNNITFPNHRDSSRGIPAEYGTAMYPETYIIERDGRIARKIIGPQQWDTKEWVEFIQSLAKGS